MDARKALFKRLRGFGWTTAASLLTLRALMRLG
jgi:hypothetical protein